MFSSAYAKDPAMLTIEQAANAVRRGELSPVELTSACLHNIDELDPRLHAFITVTGHAALEEAFVAEREIAAGSWRGPLHGIPIALKDLLDTPGIRTTGASHVYESRIPDVEAEVVRRLRAAGAVIIGKTNLHEFAYGCSSVVTAFGDVHNPHAPERIAGGSSSGSAVAVATGMCIAAIGTDTAGSIRLPAAFCGVVGLKPTYELVSRDGVIPLAPSYDHVGPITRTVADAEIVLRAIADEEYERTDRTFSPFRVGVARDYFFEHMDPEIKAITEAALSRIEAAFGKLTVVRIEVDEDRTIHKAEAFAYHAPLLDKNSDLYQPQTLARILSGSSITPAEYGQACMRLRRIRAGARTLFHHVDVIITPTCPVDALVIADLKADDKNLRAREIEMLRNTRPFNVLGLPSITIPCGWTSAGLPVGIQFTAAMGQDARLLEFASALERLLNVPS